MTLTFILQFGAERFQKNTYLLILIFYHKSENNSTLPLLHVLPNSRKKNPPLHWGCPCTARVKCSFRTSRQEKQFYLSWFSKGCPNFNPSMGKLVVQKLISRLTSVQPASWKVFARSVLLAIASGADECIQMVGEASPLSEYYSFTEGFNIKCVEGGIESFSFV